MQPDQIKTITFDEQAHLAIQKGVNIMRDAVGSTYGPGGRNVLIKKKYVQPVLTRDGVTVARDIAGHGNKLNDPIAAEAAKLVYQASEKTNKTAGDGTTATVVLLAELYNAGRQQIASGKDAMLVKRQLDKDRDSIVKFIESKSQECDKDKLNQVATISAGDKDLGHLIADLVHEVGSDGAISIEYQNAPSIDVEKVTGYLFGNGFRHLAVNEVELQEPMVFVTQKRMASRNDIIPILETAEIHQRQFVIVGDVAGAALETLVWAIQNQKADGLCIPPPAYGADGHEYFEDIAAYTGARLWLESDSFKNVQAGDFGSIKKARIARDKATLYGKPHDTRQIIGDNGAPTLIEVNIGHNVAERINLIKEQMDKADNPHVKEVLEQRLAKLSGKVAVIKVGAATEVEREELFFRVEDAVEACKSAMSMGIVAGGATTLLFASDYRGEGGSLDNGGMQIFETKPIVEPFVRDALQKPFRLLMEHSAEDGGYRAQQVLKAGYGKGFNLREMTDEPVDLFEAGVVDATKVVLQTVKNAFANAGALLTTGTTITVEEENEKA
jgi:chaperonin GroEL